LRESKGKRSIADVLREIYKKHKKSNTSQDGNTAILNIFETRAELRPVVERYIKSAEKIKWQTDLESVGIELNGENFPAKLAVKSKLNGRQKDLLDKLGYNNRRKISEISK
jgi:predicted metalloprotease with PDZ domain